MAAVPSTPSGDGEVIPGWQGRGPSQTGPSVGTVVVVGEGVGDGVTRVGDSEAVGDGDAVIESVGRTEGVVEGVRVGVAVDVDVNTGVAICEGEAEGDADHVGVAVQDGLGVGEGVGLCRVATGDSSPGLEDAPRCTRLPSSQASATKMSVAMPVS